MRVGDTVVIEKAGEIIPQVVRVETAVPLQHQPPFAFPAVLPELQASAARVEGESDYRCANLPLRVLRAANQGLVPLSLPHRDAMDVEGLGHKLIDQLVDKGFVRRLGDLYRLDAATLADLERMGKKSAQNLIDGLEASKTRSLDRLLTGLVIRHVGTRGAEILAERFAAPRLEAIREREPRTTGSRARGRPGRRRERVRVLPG